MPSDNPQSYKTGRDHPASQPVPTSGEEGRSAFGRDSQGSKLNPTPPQGEVPNMGRDHPAVEDPFQKPKSTNPFKGVF